MENENEVSINDILPIERLFDILKDSVPGTARCVSSYWKETLDSQTPDSQKKETAHLKSKKSDFFQSDAGLEWAQTQTTLTPKSLCDAIEDKKFKLTKNATLELFKTSIMTKDVFFKLGETGSVELLTLLVQPDVWPFVRYKASRYDQENWMSFVTFLFTSFPNTTLSWARDVDFSTFVLEPHTSTTHRRGGPLQRNCHKMALRSTSRFFTNAETVMKKNFEFDFDHSTLNFRFKAKTPQTFLRNFDLFETKWFCFSTLAHFGSLLEAVEVFELIHHQVDSTIGQCYDLQNFDLIFCELFRAYLPNFESVESVESKFENFLQLTQRFCKVLKMHFSNGHYKGIVKRDWKTAIAQLCIPKIFVSNWVRGLELLTQRYRNLIHLAVVYDAVKINNKRNLRPITREMAQFCIDHKFALDFVVSRLLITPNTQLFEDIFFKNRKLFENSEPVISYLKRKLLNTSPIVEWLFTNHQDFLLEEMVPYRNLRARFVEFQNNNPWCDHTDPKTRCLPLVNFINVNMIKVPRPQNKGLILSKIAEGKLGDPNNETERKIMIHLLGDNVVFAHPEFGPLTKRINFASLDHMKFACEQGLDHFLERYQFSLCRFNYFSSWTDREVRQYLIYLDKHFPQFDKDTFDVWMIFRNRTNQLDFLLFLKDTLQITLKDTYMFTLIMKVLIRENKLKELFASFIAPKYLQLFKNHRFEFIQVCLENGGVEHLRVLAENQFFFESDLGEATCLNIQLTPQQRSRIFVPKQKQKRARSSSSSSSTLQKNSKNSKNAKRFKK